jgi:hypothetical protein
MCAMSAGQNRTVAEGGLLWEFTDKPVTAWGGMIPLARLLEQSGVREDWADPDLMDTGNLTSKEPRHEQGTGPEEGVQTARRGLQAARARSLG